MKKYNVTEKSFCIGDIEFTDISSENCSDRFEFRHGKSVAYGTFVSLHDYAIEDAPTQEDFDIIAKLLDQYSIISALENNDASKYIVDKITGSGNIGVTYTLMWNGAEFWIGESVGHGTSFPGTEVDRYTVHVDTCRSDTYTDREYQYELDEIIESMKITR